MSLDRNYVANSFNDRESVAAQLCISLRARVGCYQDVQVSLGEAECVGRGGDIRRQDSCSIHSPSGPAERHAKAKSDHKYVTA